MKRCKKCGQFKGKNHLCPEQSWSKGLTKETDKSIKKISEALKGRHTSLRTEFKKGHTVPKKWRRAVSSNMKKRIGNKHPNWKGGQEVYLRKQAKSILKNAGFDLKGKIIHHKDGNVRNNSINNLQVMNSSEHSRYHYLKGDYPEMNRVRVRRGLT